MRHLVSFATLILAAACPFGCGGGDEPTRFIPPPASESAATAPATAAAGATRSVPPRNIEMH